MDELNSFVRKAFLFLIALYPWINYVARRVPLLGTVFDDLLVITFLVYALIVGRNRVVKIFESPTVLFAMLFVAVSLFSFFFNDYLFLAFQHQFRLFIEPFLVFISVVLVAPTKSDIEFLVEETKEGK